MGKQFNDIVNSEQIFINIKKQKSVRMHSHDFLELVYVVSGQAVQIRDNERTIVKPGDYYIIDYNSYHEYIADDNGFYIINCLFIPRFIDPALNGCRSFPKLLNNYLIRFSADFSDVNPAMNIYHDDDGKIKDILFMLLEEYGEKKRGYFEIIRCGLAEIIIRTVRRISAAEKTEKYDVFSKYIIEYIGENYMRSVTLSEIAKKINFSVSYLSKVFKENTGVGFNDYLQKIRVEEACRLLADTNSKVIDIAWTVGYNDISTFNSVFKKHLGITPSMFRKTFEG